MSSQSNQPDKDIITRLTMILAVIGGFFSSVIWRGATRWSTWEWRRIKRWLIYFAAITSVVYAPGGNLTYWMDRLSWIFPAGLGEWVDNHIALPTQLFLLTVIPFLGWLAGIGGILMIKTRPIQKAVEHLGMTSPAGSKLKVVDVEPLSEGQNKILLQAIGFDVAQVQLKKAILESCLNLFVQDIRVSENSRRIIEILVSDRDLPTLVPYDKVVWQLTEPFSFMVGDGMRGFIVASLKKIHHLLIAGSSGYGKSFFTKQVLVGLLQSSKHIQLYLLDLKRGVEVKVFEPLENVLIAKEMIESVEVLDAVCKEMDRRFDYLESKGFVEIDCERDKLDRIVVFVDEASELFTVIKSNKSVKASAEKARDLADRIAKLGRVAGIHLILATQKVVKETIDTRVQANINARLVLRVNERTASTTVLGNTLAYELPEIKGCGIWSVGAKDIVVQTPKLDNEEVGKKVALLAEKFNGNANPLFQKMLTIRKQKAEGSKETTKSNDESSVNMDAGVI